jgi:hypothetical protein
LIRLVIAVTIANEGQMTQTEALAIFDVTVKRSKWLLSQVHPDRYPDFFGGGPLQPPAQHASTKPWMGTADRSRHMTDWKL